MLKVRLDNDKQNNQKSRTFVNFLTFVENTRGDRDPTNTSNLK